MPVGELHQRQIWQLPVDLGQAYSHGCSSMGRAMGTTVFNFAVCLKAKSFQADAKT
jgi:hypothetical protein